MLPHVDSREVTSYSHYTLSTTTATINFHVALAKEIDVNQPMRKSFACERADNSSACLAYYPLL